MLRRLAAHITPLNCIITLALLLIVSYVLTPIICITPITVTPVAPKVTEGKKDDGAQTQQPSPMDYVIIADQNLFHPERKIPEIKVELPKPEFVLFGTTITSGVSLAYMEDRKTPFSTPGRGKRQRTVKKGEALSGYTLKEVAASQVTMVRGEDIIIVKLDEPFKTRGPETATSSAAPQPGAPMPITPQPMVSLPRPPVPISSIPQAAPTAATSGSQPTPEQSDTRQPTAMRTKTIRPLGAN
jgi:hypothetical protein